MAKVRRRLISASKFDKRIPSQSYSLLIALLVSRPSLHGDCPPVIKMQIIVPRFPAIGKKLPRRTGKTAFPAAGADQAGRMPGQRRPPVGGARSKGREQNAARRGGPGAAGQAAREREERGRRSLLRGGIRLFLRLIVFFYFTPLWGTGIFWVRPLLPPFFSICLRSASGIIYLFFQYNLDIYSKCGYTISYHNRG